MSIMKNVISYLIFLFLLMIPLMLAANNELNNIDNFDANSFDFDEMESLVEKELEFYSIEETVVSASKRVQAAKDAPAAITVITSEQIRRSGLSTISEILRRVPGMLINYMSPYWSVIGMRSHISTSNDSLLVLVDWREINTETYGHPLWEALPVTLADIDRIEIIRGPGSALYGANAFNGIVNILTKKASNKFSMDAGVKYGDFNSLSGHILSMGKINKYSYKLSAGMDKADSMSTVKRLGKKVYKVSGLVEYKISKKSTILLDMGYVWSKGTMNGGDSVGTVNLKDIDQSYISTHYNKYNFRFKSYLSLHRIHDGFMDLDLNATLDKDANTLGYELIDGDEELLGELIYLNELIDQTYIWDAEALYDITNIPKSILTIGVQTRRTSMHSDSLLHNIEPEWRLGTFLNFEYKPLVGLIITSGIRSDVNTADLNMISPRLNVSWSPSNKNIFRFGYIQAFRKPSLKERLFKPKTTKPNTSMNRTFNEAYGEYSLDNPSNQIAYIFSKAIGNMDIDSEKVYGFDFGYLTWFFHSKLKINFDIYYLFYRDFIEFPGKNEDDVVEGCNEKINPLDEDLCENIFYNTFKNVETPRDSYGAELSLFYRITSQSDIWLNGSYKQVNEVTKNWPWSDEVTGNYKKWAKENNREQISSYSYYRLYHALPFWNFNAGLKHITDSGFIFNILAHYISKHERVWNRGVESSIYPFNYFSINPIFLLHTNLSYRFKIKESVIEFGISAENLLDSNQIEMSSGIKRGIDSNIYGQDQNNSAIPMLPIDTQLGAEPHRRKVLFFVRGEI